MGGVAGGKRENGVEQEGHKRAGGKKQEDGKTEGDRGSHTRWATHGAPETEKAQRRVRQRKRTPGRRPGHKGQQAK